MIYDEGVEINIKNFSFFSYFKYTGNLKSYKSDCSKSLVGFYSYKNKPGKYKKEYEYGCFTMK